MRLRFGVRAGLFPNALIFIRHVNQNDGVKLLKLVSELKFLASAIGFGSVADRIVCEES